MHNGGSNGAGMKVAGTFGDVLVQVQGEAAELLRGAVGEGGGAAVRDPEEGGAALSSKEDEGTIRGLDDAKVAPVLGGGGDQLEGTEGVKKDNLNFTEVDRNGEKVFICNICKDESDQQSKVKRHITMKHLKVNKRDREDEDDDRGEMKKTQKQVIEFTESILDEFDSTGFCSSTQKGGEGDQFAEFEDVEDMEKSEVEVTIV